MTIRELAKTDFPAVIAIEALTQTAPWSEAAFERCWEANYRGWVIEQDNKIIGFILLSLKIGECHVLNLSVHPDKQRQGLGEEMMNYGLSWAKENGAGIVYLEVRRSNLAAIALYRKMNFKLIGERNKYYLSSLGAEDALVFARDLGIEM
jgi:ribosomal-protein-alanine N-acetyltransferase